MAIFTGVIGNENINCCDAFEVGKIGLSKMEGQKFKDLSFKPKDKVLPLISGNSSL